MGILFSLDANIWVQIYSGFFCSIGINKLKLMLINSSAEDTLKNKILQNCWRTIEKEKINVRKELQTHWLTRGLAFISHMSKSDRECTVLQVLCSF